MQRDKANSLIYFNEKDCKVLGYDGVDTYPLAIHERHAGSVERHFFTAMNALDDRIANLRAEGAAPNHPDTLEVLEDYTTLAAIEGELVRIRQENGMQAVNTAAGTFELEAQYHCPPESGAA